MKAIAQSEEERICNTCEESWPADREFFYADSSAKGGLSYYCKACYCETIRPPESRRKDLLPALEPRNLLLEQSWMKGAIA